MFVRTIQIQHADCDFLLRGQGGHERRPGRGLLEGKRRLKNLLEQIPAFAEFARSRRCSPCKPGLDLGIDQGKAAQLPNPFIGSGIGFIRLSICAVALSSGAGFTSGWRMWPR